MRSFCVFGGIYGGFPNHPKLKAACRRICFRKLKRIFFIYYLVAASNHKSAKGK